MQKINPADPKIEQNTLKEKLIALCPEIFIEGKINFDALQTLLPDELEDEEATREHFGLNWTGKTQARRLALTRPRGSTLRPALGEGINEETTQNVFIEGDNLEVLKILREAYSDQVKMIYIDPPYNTGNDFIYKDDFSETIDDYLKRTQQKDGNTLLVANPKASGRFHSNWLNFIYPRLRIARELLTEDGVIFVSIDDNEVHNLRQAMNEIFGEENFIGTFIWQSKKGGGSDSGSAVNDHEYVIAFGKSSLNKALSKIEIQAEELDKLDEKGAYRRGRELNKWGANSRREDRPTMFFPVIGPNGEDVYPIRNDNTEGCWRLGKKKMFDVVERGDAEFVQRNNNTYVVFEKIRSTDSRTKPYRTYLVNTGTTADGSKTVKEIFEGNKMFDFAKPIALIKQLIKIGTIGDEIVMDFFAGSGTTAQAVLELNNEEESDLKFICVQMPEIIKDINEASKFGYNNISQLSQERIRRVISKTNQEKEKPKNELFPSTEHQNLDLGFKVFKLDESNLSVWQNFKGADTAQLSLAFQKQTENPLKEGWHTEALRVEMMLLEGFPLHSKQEKVAAFTKNEICKITSDFNHNALYMCLDTILEDSTVNALLLETDDIFICLDEALTDLQKTNLDDKLKLKTI